MAYYNEQAHFVEYQLDSFDQDRREAVLELLKMPDSFEVKRKFYDRFADRTREDTKFWNDMDLAFEQFAPKLDGEKKKVLEVDIYASCEIYGIAPEEYFQFQFYWKNDQGRNQYMGDKERFVVFRPCYHFDEYEKIRNKWQMYQQIGQYFGRQCILVGAESDKDAGYEEFCRYTDGKSEFVFKPLRASCGKGVRRISLSKTADRKVLYEKLCAEGGGIADELICQDETLAKFHRQSANSVRLITLRDRQGGNHFVQSMFRMGQRGSFVDNDSGAIRARIDETNGYVFTCGYDSYGNQYILHPDSGEVIPGFQIPAWEELLGLADRVMNEISSYARFIGFDLALTAQGWSVIEVNPFPQLVVQQIITGQGIRKDMLRLANECV